MIHDCDTVFDAIWTAYTAGGVIIPGLADRNGQRYIMAGTCNHGGKRMKNDEGVEMGLLNAERFYIKRGILFESSTEKNNKRASQ